MFSHSKCLFIDIVDFLVVEISSVTEDESDTHNLYQHEYSYIIHAHKWENFILYPNNYPSPL